MSERNPETGLALFGVVLSFYALYKLSVIETNLGDRIQTVDETLTAKANKEHVYVSDRFKLLEPLGPQIITSTDNDGDEQLLTLAGKVFFPKRDIPARVFGTV